ncbi:Retrotransposon gag protein [Rhizoctonia solani]|uniref:Retrotransposon gag protein n=1 Tax=Rhizoctonia solani TaxID=456999 RepID=A0A8H7I718_9AGAM|nr:Retrotransposon gag protein [Rhizoctonia solani]
MPGLGAMGETNLTPSQIQSGWSAPSSRTHTPAPAAVPPHVYSPMSFDQMLDSPPPPPPPAGTSTATNIPPAPITSSSNLKFAKPNKFSGKKEDALNFIIACQAYIRAKGANQSHKEKILWVTSYFEGAAEDWVRPYKERKFTKHYVDTNCNEKYWQKWNNLRQKALVQEYTREFQQYSVSLGYSDETLRDKYYNGLKNKIKDIMLSTMFQWRCATAQQVYNKAEEIANHIESTRLSNPSASTICATPTAVPTSNSNPTPTSKCEVEWGNKRYNDSIPSLKKDERPAAAAPVKTIIAPPLF